MDGCGSYSEWRWWWTISSRNCCETALLYRSSTNEMVPLENTVVHNMERSPLLQCNALCVDNVCTMWVRATHSLFLQQRAQESSFRRRRRRRTDGESLRRSLARSLSAVAAAHLWLSPSFVRSLARCAGWTCIALRNLCRFSFRCPFVWIKVSF